MPPVTRTLLLTDVVDSTRLVEALGDVRAAQVWARHDQVARELLPAHDGLEIDKTDGFLLLFQQAADGVSYAAAYHAALQALSRELGVALAARAGLHVGEVVLRENPPDQVARGAKPLEVEGLAKPLAARVMSVAGAAQTLLSEDARQALPDDLADGLVAHGHWRMKGVSEPIALFEAPHPGAPLSPPPDGAKVYRVVQREGAWVPARELPGNLGAPPDAFVGRRDELLALARVFEEGPRLVTVAGPPGVGKSRLAARYGRVWAGDWPEGVFRLDLSGQRSLPALPAAGLLVLDNADLISPEAFAGLSGPTLLVTRRRPLGLPGERALRLSPLPSADALALLQARWSSGEPDPALVDILGGSPRDLEHAARNAGATELRPFRGLASFTAADQHLFFGREDEAADLARQLLDHQLVTVTGPSGSGKTSLLRAGLSKHLPHHDVIVVRPGSDPAEHLITGLRQISPERVGPVLAALGDEHASLDGAGKVLSASARPLLVVIDQAEEALTLTREGPKRDALGHATVALASLPHTLVALVVREDFFARLAEVGSLKGRYNRSVVVLTRPDIDQLRRTLHLPAALFGHRFDEGLVDEMIEAVAHDPAALPMLQFCADQLWQRRAGGMLTRQAYDALGGVGGALATHADAVIAQLSAPGREEARRQLLRLVTVELTREPRERSVLAQSSADAALANDVLDRLIAARLLAVFESETGTPVVELVHEALLTHWQQLQDWMGEDRDGQRMVRAIDRAAKDWDRAGRDIDRLWRGDQVTQLRLWRGRSQQSLSPLETAFVQGSIAAERQRLRSRRIGWTAAALFLASVAVGALALWQRAEDSATAATESARQSKLSALIANAQLLAARGKEPLAIRLAAHAVAENRDSEPARSALYGLLEDHNEHTLVPIPEGYGRTPLSPRGDRVFLFGYKPTAELVDDKGLQVAQLPIDNQGGVTQGAWSPDGAYLVTAGSQARVQIWSPDGDLLASSERYETSSARFSPDSRLISVRVSNAGGSDARILIMDLQAQVIASSETLPYDFESANWSRDGRFLVAENRNPQGRPMLMAYELTEAGSLEERWRPDWNCPVGGGWAGGHTMFLPGPDCKRRFWSLTGERLSPAVELPKDSVVALSDDEQVIAFANGQVRGLITGFPNAPVVHAAPYRGCRDPAFLRWKEDGSQLAMSCRDGKIEVMDTDLSEVDRRAYEHMIGAWFPPDIRLFGRSILEGHSAKPELRWVGDMLVSVATDGTLRTWPTDSSGPHLRDIDEALRTCQWTDGGLSIDSSWGDLYLFEPTGARRMLFPLAEYTGVDWSPDGSRLAAVRVREGTVVVFDPQGEILAEVPAVDPAVDGVASEKGAPHKKQRVRIRWSPDGQSLVALAPSGGRIVDASGAVIAELDGFVYPQDDRLPDARWSPDGTRVAAGDVRTLGLWKPDGTLVATHVRDPDSPGEQRYGIHWQPSSSEAVLIRRHRATRAFDVFTMRADGSLVDHPPDRFQVQAPSTDRSLRPEPDGHFTLVTGHKEVPLPSDSEVRDWRWAEDGSRLVTFHQDGTAVMWSGDGARLAAWGGSEAPLASGCIAPDGDHMITFSFKGDHSDIRPLTDALLLERAQQLVPVPLTDDQRDEWLD